MAGLSSCKAQRRWDFDERQDNPDLGISDLGSGIEAVVGLHYLTLDEESTSVALVALIALDALNAFLRNHIM
jgi:hypothetical protein